MNADITEIFKNYYTYIYNYALKLTCHPEDAKDITQETFIKAWSKLATLRQENALGKWLCSICYHEFLMKVRNQGSAVTLTEEEWAKLELEGRLVDEKSPTLEEEVIVAEEVKNLQNGCFLAMVRRLTLQQRIAFSLVDMFGMDIEEVAVLLGVTKGAAKGLLYRARMNIDSFFADHCNLIYEKNPCSCKAWLDFSKNRSDMQKKTKQLVNTLDYLEKGYHYDELVRKRVMYLYAHMPEQKPSMDWYDGVIVLLGTKNVE